MLSSQASMQASMGSIHAMPTGVIMQGDARGCTVVLQQLHPCYICPCSTYYRPLPQQCDKSRLAHLEDAAGLLRAVTKDAASASLSMSKKASSSSADATSDAASEAASSDATLPALLAPAPRTGWYLEQLHKCDSV